MTIKSVKPTLPEGLDGAWLLTVVATEAIAILATHVSDVFSRSEIVVFMSLCLFLLGGGLYLILISLIVQRWVFAPMQPEQLTLPYWINMGAAAITTLAGAHLTSLASADRLTASLAQLIEATTAVPGARDLVDSTAGGASILAPCDPQSPSSIRPAILVDGVSLRDVYRSDLGFIAAKWPRISCSDTTGKHLGRIGLMAAWLCCNHTASLALALPETEELRAW